MKEITLTNDNFKEAVLEETKPVLVDFWATWCGPCKMQAPVLEELAAERDDFVIGKVNVDDESDLANAFQIDMIPTLIVFKGGVAVSSAVGFQSKEKLLKMIEAQ